MFILDNFIGNEKDHVVISTVRTAGVGFLQDIRRTNVMLTRCKKSMWICANKSFLQTTGSYTLLGKLAWEWSSDGWNSLDRKWPRIDRDGSDEGEDDTNQDVDQYQHNL